MMMALSAFATAHGRPMVISLLIRLKAAHDKSIEDDPQTFALQILERINKQSS